MVQSIIRIVWFTEERVKVEQIQPNVFIFCFKTVADKDRIWRKKPWSIDGAHIVLRKWKPNLLLKILTSTFRLIGSRFTAHLFSS